ncbi:MAG: glucosidase, partial [Bryobacteraceae bacterium]
MTAEEKRLEEARTKKVHWKRWGPYLSERAWGTVREDYSEHGTAWEFLPHDAARSKAYRWNEDGIAGISDRHQRICFSVAMWNGRDPILKERLFGLTGNEGNHGEDVKECYYYLDSTPTHSYMKYLYKYPQCEFPYTRLIVENRNRGRGGREFELIDTGAFAEGRYFDVIVEYAKAGQDDILIRIDACNRGPEDAELCLLPTIWFRNTWSWNGHAERPELCAEGAGIELQDGKYGSMHLTMDGEPELLFTENDTNTRRLYGDSSGARYVKDGFHSYVVNGDRDAVNPERHGTKAAALYWLRIPAGGSARVRLRLAPTRKPIDASFDTTFAQRIHEANEFYAAVIPADLSPDGQNVMRQSFAGLLWSKQFYHYVVRDWLDGDSAQPPPPTSRRSGRNRDWPHLYNADVISMPDKWEYPWYAAWDLAFHCVPLAIVDSDFAKEQLLLMTREWYMHPNGQLPAYE